MMVAGRPMSRSACCTAATALPREAPARTSKLMVTEGNCDWWVITSGAVRRTRWATASNGTCATVFVVATVLVAICAAPLAPKLATVPGTRRRIREPGSAIQAGSACITTRYWLLC